MNVFDQLAALGLQGRGGGKLAAATLLQEQGLYVGRVVDLVFQGPHDGGQHVLPAIEPHQGQQPPQMDRGLHRHGEQFQVELAGQRSQGVELLLALAGPAASPQFHRCQAVFVADDQPAPLVTAWVPRHFLARVDDPHLAGVGPQRDRLADQRRRHGVAVAVITHAGVGGDDQGNDLVGIEAQCRQGTQMRAFLLETVDGPLLGGGMQADIGHFVPPPGGQAVVRLPGGQLLAAARQGAAFDIPHAPLDDPFGFRVACRAGDRLQAEVAAEGQEVLMEASVPPRAVEHCGLEVVHDQLPRAALEELQGVHHAAVKVGLPLREAELDVAQPAVAEHGHEHRDPPRSLADRQPSAVAPIDLHRLARLVDHFLIDPSPRGPDLVQIAPYRVDRAAIAVLSLGDFLRDSRCVEVGILGQQRVDLRPVTVEDAFAWGSLATRVATPSPRPCGPCGGNSAVAGRSPPATTAPLRANGGSPPKEKLS